MVKIKRDWKSRRENVEIILLRFFWSFFKEGGGEREVGEYRIV